MSTDVRRLLASHRQSRRISSPYATYSLAGALFCSACNNLPIKSESLWDAHTRTPTHRTNVANSLPPKAGKRPKNDDDDDDLDLDGEKGPDSRKRIKVDGGSLPAGFFDGSGVDRRVDLDAESEDEEDEGHHQEEAIPQPTVTATTITTEKKKPTALPSDFFSEKSTTAALPNKDIDAEWEAFQADIAQTEEEEVESESITKQTIAPPITAVASASTHVISAAPMTASESAAAVEDKRAIDAEDREEEQDRMAEFFDEQSSLEDRVRALKEKREKLRMGMAGVTSTTSAEPAVAPATVLLRRGSEMDVDEKPADTGGGDQGDEDEDDDEDDEDAFDSWARGGVWH